MDSEHLFILFILTMALQS